MINTIVDNSLGLGKLFRALLISKKLKVYRTNKI